MLEKGDQRVNMVSFLDVHRIATPENGMYKYIISEWHATTSQHTHTRNDISKFSDPHIFNPSSYDPIS